MHCYIVTDDFTFNVVYAHSMEEATNLVAKKDGVVGSQEELADTYNVTRLTPELVNKPDIMFEAEMVC